ncbi:hypothetical protein [Methylobacterium radiotolerans]|uniref:hypothetical protein n=1 Tax=Methylobacterium radiotolerans TaxID=31998 RepID=UPI0015F7063F|nr:hypothetical protein [Methylobacterium radiotolerans]
MSTIEVSVPYGGRIRIDITVLPPITASVEPMAAEPAGSEPAATSAEFRPNRTEQAKAERAARASIDTVGGFANRLLMEVVDTQNGEAQGHSYGQIVRRIREVFPGSTPTLSSLRWYETKLRRVHGRSAVPSRINDLGARH